MACKRREEGKVPYKYNATLSDISFIRVARSDGPSGNRKSIPEDPEAL